MCWQELSSLCELVSGFDCGPSFSLGVAIIIHRWYAGISGSSVERRPVAKNIWTKRYHRNPPGSSPSTRAIQCTITMHNAYDRSNVWSLPIFAARLGVRLVSDGFLGKIHTNGTESKVMKHVDASLKQKGLVCSLQANHKDRKWRFIRSKLSFKVYTNGGRAKTTVGHRLAKSSAVCLTWTHCSILQDEEDETPNRPQWSW